MKTVQSIKLNSVEYNNKLDSYEKKHRYRVIRSNSEEKFTARENNKSYCIRFIAGIGLSILSIGLAPLFFHSVRSLFYRKVRVFNLEREFSKKASSSSNTSSSSSKSVSTSSKTESISYKTASISSENSSFSKSDSSFEDSTPSPMDLSPILDIDRLFPTSPQIMERGVLEIAFGYLNRNEFVKLKEVSKEWNQQIGKSYTLKKFLKLNFLSDLEKLCGSCTDTQIMIIKEIAKIDIDEAKKSVLTLPDTFYRTRALLEIAKVDPHPDLNEIRKQIPRTFKHCRADFEFEIAKLDPNRDLTKVKKHAGLISDPYKRAKIQLEIAKIDSNKDLKAVKISTSLISDPYKRAKFKFRIAKIDPNQDFSEAKKSALTLERASDSRYLLFKIIRKELKNKDFEDVDFSGINDRQFFKFNNREYFLIENEKKKSNPDIDKLKKIAESVDEIDIRASLQRQIAELDPSYIYQAFETAIIIEDIDNKFSNLFYLVKNNLQFLPQVKTEILAITDPATKIKKLLMFANFDHDIEEVQNLVEMIDDVSKDQYLLELVKIQAEWDIDGAKLNAQAIQNPLDKAEALIEIAKLDPLHEIDEALKIILSINIGLNWLRITSCFASIVGIQAKYGKLQDALDSFKNFDKQYNRQGIRELLKYIHRIDEYIPTVDSK